MSLLLIKQTSTKSNQISHFLRRQIVLDPVDKIFNNEGKGPIVFPFDGRCTVNIKASASSAYQFYCSATRVNYSDQPILFNGMKTLYFWNYRGKDINFDLFNRANIRNKIQLDIKFERRRFSEQEYSFREWTLNVLNWRAPIQIQARGEVQISPINYTGAHFEVRGINSVSGRQVYCKIEYQNKIIEDWFSLADKHVFNKPWLFRWAHPIKLFLRNDNDSDLSIEAYKIYFSGHKIRPVDVLEKVSASNLRSSFLIEGIEVG